MKLKDFAMVAENNYIVGVEKGYEIVEEFFSYEKDMISFYEDYIVTGIWILDEDTLAVNIIK